MADKDGSSEERVVITAKVSRDAAEGWRQFCDGNGVSLTSMLEIAGLELANESLPPTVEARQRMIGRAREVDRERRVRKRS